MLADKLDKYKRRGNQYVDDNIQKIQELYKEEEQRQESRSRKVEEEEIILIKPYKVLTTTSRTTSSKTTESSFIHDEIKNLEQHMKFIHSPTKKRLFKPLPHYQSLCFRGEQNPEFWKKIAAAFVKEKYNMETLQNVYPISMYQGGSPHEPYLIAVDN